MRPAASRRAMKQPSHLISCSQPGPAGGRWASAGWQGRMNQTGLERVRIGREETRQSIRRREEKGGAASLTGGGSDCESGWTYLTPNNMARSCTKFSHSLDRNPLTDLSVVGLKMGSIVQFEKAFASVGWFIPAYVQMGGLKRLPSHYGINDRLCSIKIGAHVIYYLQRRGACRHRCAPLRDCARH
jgi:hypothetical protein